MKYVKVIKCDNPKSWYYSRIGEIFKVDSDSVRDYYIKREYGISCILKTDGDVVESLEIENPVN
jgi:hypothetical protein